MLYKKVFIGLDYVAPYFYLSGLSTSFQWLFHRCYHREEHLEMYAFLKSCPRRELIYRIPNFFCHFKRYRFECFYSLNQVYDRTCVFQFKHAVRYLGFQNQLHYYHVAYVDKGYYRDQVDLLGLSKNLLTRVDIDDNALWLYRSQQHPLPGLIRCLEYHDAGGLHRLYGRDECFWFEDHQTLEADVVDKLDDNSWYIAQALAFGAYINAL